jgi:hypothetical protein
MPSNFDFTKACEFRDAAVKDGWLIEPTYEHESIDRAATLKKEGFFIQVITRLGKEASINIWGPDGMAINPPDTYSWAAISSGLCICNLCGKTDVETHRFSFAGRACLECLPAAKKKHEYPGWTN